MTREEQIKKLDAMAKPRSEEVVKKAEERKKQRSRRVYMEVRELMIGDWVMYNRVEPIMVYEIDDYYERINTEPDGYNAIRCVEISEITPIPLTAEILEKNGFIKGDEVSDYPPYDRDEEGNMYYSYKGEHKFWGWWQPDNIYFIPANAMGNIEIKFVHELQHALRLCGIEKKIEI